jgi:hypothetical protein
MESLIVLAIGVVIGSLFTWFGISIHTAWRKSKDLHSSSIKARKEEKEKALKAKQDAEKARAAGARAIFQVALLVLAVLFVAWLAWLIVQL